MKYLVITTVLFLFVGCSNETTKTTITDKVNPASQKCIADGFSLVPLKKNGVVVDYFCVNKQNGKKCKEWDYFNGKCNLF